MTSSSTVAVLELVKAEEISGGGRGEARAFFDHDALTIQGWAIGGSSPAVEVELLDSRQRLIARGPVNMPRPDIAEMLAEPGGAATAGFRLVLEAHGAGDDELTVQLVFGDGSRSPLTQMNLRVHPPPSSGVRRLLGRLRRGAEQVSWVVLSISGESEKVLVGQDGWLFLRRDSNDVMGQHTGRVKLTGKDRRAWSQVLERRLAVAEELEVTWLCVVIPDKESLYPEHLPVGTKPSKRRPIDDLLDVAARAGAPVIYPLRDLEEAKPHSELYAKTDTHWNHRGAYVVYQLICEELLRRGVHVDGLDEGSIEWSEESHPGDLGIKVYPGPVNSAMIRARLAQHAGKLVFDNGLRNHGRVLVFERDGAADAPTCVVFGESFVENLLIFLKETFRRVVVVHTSMFVKEIVEEERPDLVLSLPLERFMVRVPDDADSLNKLESVARRKGGKLPWFAAGTAG